MHSERAPFRSSLKSAGPTKAGSRSVSVAEHRIHGFREDPPEAARLESFGKVLLLVISRDPEREKMTERKIATERAWDQEQEASESLSTELASGRARGRPRSAT